MLWWWSVASSASFDASEIIRSLDVGHIRGENFISDLTTYYALQGEGYAKVNARWTDRTGNARGGIVGQADNSGARRGHWEIHLAHSVSYGIWLEVRFGGRYAIIRPTLERIAPQYWRDASQLMGRMYGR